MARQRHLRCSVALERDGRRSAGEPGEMRSERQRVAPLHDDIGIGVRPAQQLVPDVSADDPGLDALLRCRLLEQAKELAVVYWLIRAHSTAPTCPARSPSRARRTRGRRAGLMKGDE